MSEGCVDCGCPLEVCCGTNRKKYVPVSELKKKLFTFKEKNLLLDALDSLEKDLGKTRKITLLKNKVRGQTLEELGLSEKAVVEKCVQHKDGRGFTYNEN